jgi:hypothetical protein
MLFAQRGSHAISSQHLPAAREGGVPFVFPIVSYSWLFLYRHYRASCPAPRRPLCTLSIG